jgi:hypothetical protein
MSRKIDIKYATYLINKICRFQRSENMSQNRHMYIVQHILSIKYVVKNRHTYLINTMRRKISTEIMQHILSIKYVEKNRHKLCSISYQ